MDESAVLSLVSKQAFAVWFLAGAALVFWMQAGFAMVETGFTRAKNAGNIIMKNLMDFCIGTVVFIPIGFGLLLGEDLAGFIGAAATSVEQLGSIFLTTTVAPAVATVVCMVFTWVKYGKPDVSMCLNASLAGLVGITAPCDTTDCFGAICVGVVSGLLVCFGVWLLDYKLRIDDPVGAVAVHMMNGIWGTLAVGLFSTTSVPGNDSVVGLFYGGGFHQLGLQIVGVLTVGIWTVLTITVTFLVIRAAIGLRASAEEELTGLDLTEHGLPSAYDGFDIHDHSVGADLAASGPVSADVSVPVQQVQQSVPVTSGASYGAFTKVVIICRQNKFEALRAALAQINVTGMTVIQVMGCGNQKGRVEYYRGVPITVSLHPKLKVEVVVSTVPVDQVVAAAKMALYTGNVGDGKIFIYNVENVVRVRTGEEGYDALVNEIPAPTV